jgi:hypothetical protein
VAVISGDDHDPAAGYGEKGIHRPDGVAVPFGGTRIASVQRVVDSVDHGSDYRNVCVFHRPDDIWRQRVAGWPGEFSLV